MQETGHGLRRRGGSRAVVGQSRLPHRQVSRDHAPPIWRFTQRKEHDRHEPHDGAIAGWVGRRRQASQGCRGLVADVEAASGVAIDSLSHAA